MNDVSALFNNRGLSLESFMVTTSEDDTKLYDPLLSLLHKIGSVSAESVAIEGATLETTVKILKHFEPDVLKELQIRAVDEASMQELVGLAQWKAVETLSLFLYPEQFPHLVKHLNHVATLMVDLMGHSLSNEDIVKLRDEFLSKSSRFQSCKFENTNYCSKGFMKEMCPLASTRNDLGKLVIATDEPTFFMESKAEGFEIEKIQN